MNQIFAATTILIFSVIAITLGKKPFKALSKSNNHLLVSIEGGENISLIKLNDKSIPKRENRKDIPLKVLGKTPRTAQEKINFLRYLKQSMLLGPERRLEAINLSNAWHHSSVLPILRKGLKDSDIRVIKASAQSINKYRGLSNTNKTNNQTKVRPPLNVARMR